MKSLEHIIREIREGKAEKGSKKSLEGAIRKVMKGETESSFADRTTKPITDDVGGLVGSGTGGEPKLHKEAVGIIGTDDYQGNQFKSVRTQTPHIKPPAGAGSHSQAPENVSRQRTLAKERTSMTLHGKVSEGVKEKLAEPLIKGLEDLLKVAPETNLPAVITPKGTPVKPKSGVPSKVGPRIELPAKVEPKPEVKTKTDIETKTPVEIPSKTRPAELPAVEPKVSTKELPAVEPKVSTKEKPAELPAVEPKVSTKEKPAELPAVEPKTKVELPKAVPPKGGKGLPFIPSFIGGSGTPFKEPFDYRSKRVPVASKTSHAKRHMKEDTETRKKIENMPRSDAGDRKSIQYVGRTDSDPKSTRQKTSRLATIKNVIDESKKIKIETESGKEKKFIYPNETEVVIGPNMKRNFLDVEDKKLPKDYENK